MESLQSDIYTVQRLLKHRKRCGRLEYLVKWLNWPSRFNSWEPESNILDSRLIDDYKERLLRMSLKKTKRGRKPLGIDQKITKKYRKTNGYGPIRFSPPNYHSQPVCSADSERPKIRLTIPRERILEPNSSSSTESSYCEDDTSAVVEKKESNGKPSSSLNEAKENEILNDSYFITSDPEILRKHDPLTCDCADSMPRIVKIKTPKTPRKSSVYLSSREDSPSLESSPLDNDIEINNNDFHQVKKKKKKKKKKSHRQRSPDNNHKSVHKTKNSTKLKYSPTVSPVTLPHTLVPLAAPPLATTRLKACQSVTVTDVTVNNVTLTLKECVKSPSDFFPYKSKASSSPLPIVRPVVNQASEVASPSHPVTVSTNSIKSTAATSTFSVDNLLSRNSDTEGGFQSNRSGLIVSCSYNNPQLQATPKKSTQLNGDRQTLSFHSSYSDFLVASERFSLPHRIDKSFIDDDFIQDKPIDLSARKVCD